MMTDEEYRASVKAGPAQELERAGKIYIYGKYLFVNEFYKGIHVYDNSNPRAPKSVSFLNIPGNIDMAVKGNYLYADSYGDLVVMNISDPEHATVAKWMEGVVSLPVGPEGLAIGFRYSPGVRVTGYTTRDTTYECDCVKNDEMWLFDAAFSSSSLTSKASSGSSTTGKGGSMARFTLAKDYLYTVNYSQLKAFDVSNAANPVHKGEQQITGGLIETIFPYGEYLFIGSMNSMYIYDTKNPATPAKRSQVTHFKACDPVVVEGTTAYVTLRAGNACGGAISELQVFDVKDVDKPVKLASYNMLSPFGLGVDNGKLFICEGAGGLRFLNAPSPTNITTTKLVEGINSYDVIPDNDRLLVSAQNGIYQYDYKNMSNPELLSKINIKKQ